MNNGAFELGDGTPFWTFTPNQNRYSVTPSDGKAGVLVVELISDTPFHVAQEFGKDKQGVFDFPVPQGPGTRPSAAGGYVVEEAKVLPQGDYTLHAQIRADFGAVEIAPIIEGPTANGDLSPIAVVFEGAASATVAREGWVPVVFKFTSPRRIYRVGLSVTRQQQQAHAKAEITKLGLVPGAYDQAVYTGDVLARVLPKGAIVLSLGKTCPDGFALLEEGTPPAEWTADEPTIKLKYGNFPASVTAPSGHVLHTTETLVRPDTPGVALFDGYDSRIYVEQASSFSTAPGPIDVPDRDGLASHAHEIKKAKSVPVSVSFLLCKRL